MNILLSSSDYISIVASPISQQIARFVVFPTSFDTSLRKNTLNKLV